MASEKLAEGIKGFSKSLESEGKISIDRGFLITAYRTSAIYRKREQREQ